MVSGLLQTPKNIGLPGLNEVLQATMPADVWIAACEHTTSRLRADRGLCEAVGEERKGKRTGELFVF